MSGDRTEPLSLRYSAMITGAHTKRKLTQNGKRNRRGLASHLGSGKSDSPSQNSLQVNWRRAGGGDRQKQFEGPLPTLIEWG